MRRALPLALLALAVLAWTLWPVPTATPPPRATTAPASQAPASRPTAPPDAEERPCTVTLRILTDEGPVDEAEVRLEQQIDFEPVQRWTTRSDTEGRVRFEDLTYGWYQPTVQAPGTVSQGGPTWHCQGLGERFDDEIHLVAADGTVAVSVRGTDDRVLEEARVTVYQAGDGPIVEGWPTVPVDDRGRVDAPVVRGHPYIVQATAPGHTFASVDLDVRDPVEPVDLVLARAPRIHGRVVDRAGRGVPGASVHLGPIGRVKTRGPAHSKPDGRFSRLASRGVLAVGAVAQGQVGCAEVTGVDEGTTHAVQIVVEPGVPVKGRTRPPRAGVEVRWLHADCGTAGGVTTGPDGGFEIPGVPRGPVSFWADPTRKQTVQTTLKDQLALVLDVD